MNATTCCSTSSADVDQENANTKATADVKIRFFIQTINASFATSIEGLQAAETYSYNRKIKWDDT